MVSVFDYPKFFAAPSQSAAKGIVATALLMDFSVLGRNSIENRGYIEGSDL
jgi:hypothetical protein